MDIRMPVMDGYEAAEKIKQFSNVSIVALTASIMNDALEQLKADYFDDYLKKPILKKELTEMLSTFLAHETLSLEHNNEENLNFSDADYKVLAAAIIELEQLQSQYKVIREQNNLPKITLFAESIKAITQHCPLKVVEEYAEQLIAQTSFFDIPAIERSLNHYPKLLAMLKKKSHLNTPN